MSIWIFKLAPTATKELPSSDREKNQKDFVWETCPWNMRQRLSFIKNPADVETCYQGLAVIVFFKVWEQKAILESSVLF